MEVTVESILLDRIQDLEKQADTMQQGLEHALTALNGASQMFHLQADIIKSMQIRINQSDPGQPASDGLLEDTQQSIMQCLSSSIQRLREVLATLGMDSSSDSGQAPYSDANTRY